MGVPATTLEETWWLVIKPSYRPGVLTRQVLVQAENTFMAVRAAQEKMGFESGSAESVALFEDAEVIKMSRAQAGKINALNMSTPGGI